jgi:hypothetical protein
MMASDKKFLALAGARQPCEVKVTLLLYFTKCYTMKMYPVLMQNAMKMHGKWGIAMHILNFVTG